MELLQKVAGRYRSRSLWAIFAQLRNKVPVGYNGMPQIHPKLPLSFENYHPHLIHPSLERPHSPSQTASGSTQLFCHNTLSGQTDRQTDRWSRQETCTNTRLCSIDYNDAANNSYWLLFCSKIPVALCFLYQNISVCL